LRGLLERVALLHQTLKNFKGLRRKTIKITNIYFAEWRARAGATAGAANGRGGRAREAYIAELSLKGATRRTVNFVVRIIYEIRSLNKCLLCVKKKSGEGANAKTTSSTLAYLIGALACHNCSNFASNIGYSKT